MAHHDKKTDPVVFQMSWEGLKMFEVRKNDCDYTAGDTITLHETESSGAEMAAGAPLIYTGRSISNEVNYVLHGNNSPYGIAEGWVVMDVSQLGRDEG